MHLSLLDMDPPGSCLNCVPKIDRTEIGTTEQKKALYNQREVADGVKCDSGENKARCCWAKLKKKRNNLKKEDFDENILL